MCTLRCSRGRRRGSGYTHTLAEVSCVYLPQASFLCWPSCINGCAFPFPGLHYRCLVLTMIRPLIGLQPVLSAHTSHSRVRHMLPFSQSEGWKQKTHPSTPGKLPGPSHLPGIRPKRLFDAQDPAPDCLLPGSLLSIPSHRVLLIAHATPRSAPF